MIFHSSLDVCSHALEPNCVGQRIFYHASTLEVNAGSRADEKCQLGNIGLYIARRGKYKCLEAGRVGKF